MVKENFPRPNLNSELSNQKLQGSSSFKKGEIFDPEKELKKVSRLHGNKGGLEELAIYKEKLKLQKENITEIEDEVFNFVEKNIDFSKSELEDFVKTHISSISLSNEQRQKILNITREFYKKNQAVRELLYKHRDRKDEEINGKSLYEDLFKKKPVGEIKIASGSYYIYFRFSEFEDFTYIVSEAFKNKRSLKEEDLVIAKSIDGLKILNNIQKVTGTIIVENPIHFKEEEISRSILIHEKQHIMHGFFNKYHFPDFEQGLKKKNNLEKGKDLTPEEEILLTTINPFIERNIKDEICAYFKDGTGSKHISKILLQDKNNDYDYGLKYNNTKDHFDLEYLNYVENGIVAFSNLLKAGYFLDKVVSLLYVEPLQKWPKEVERLLGKIKTPVEKEKDQNEFISKVILRRDRILKDSYII